MANDYTSAKNLEIDGIPIQPYNPTSITDEELDRNWAKIAFMVSDTELDNETDVVNQYYTSAHAKFTDTRIGCNIGINPRPQWTRYSDVRVRGRLAGRNSVSLSNISGNYGMGRAYSENQDDPAQKIFMTFGVPKFSGLVNYLVRAFDRDTTIMARTGRAPSFWYTAARVTALGFASFAAPGLAVTVAIGKGVLWLFGRPSSKFFTIKTTMFMYWSMVNHLVNNHAVNVGIFKKVLSTEEDQRLGRPYRIDTDQMADISGLMPDVFGGGGGYFDVYAIANKAQRLANQMFMNNYAKLENGSEADFYGYLKRESSGSGTNNSYISNDGKTPTLLAFLNKMAMQGYYDVDSEEEAKKPEFDPRVNPNETSGSEPKPAPPEGWFPKLLNSWRQNADAEMRDGSQWACFRVDYTGSVGEAFSSSTAESDISQKVNSISSQAKEMSFSFAGGKTGIGAIDSIVSGVTDVVSGILDGASFGFSALLSGVGGSGFMDIPKHWQSSSANLARGSYTIQLISPYGNPVSQLINIWVPFFMILAGAIPRSTGKQSYTSPFYCQLYDRGRLQSRTAMIEQLRVTRGTSNLAFDLYGKCLALDLTFDVVDLSTIMHMPMSSGSLSDKASNDMTIDEDNIAADYLNVLAGMDIYSQVYPFPKAQLRATKQLLNMHQKSTSPAFHIALLKNSVEDGFINDITLGISGLLTRVAQGPVTGNSILEGTRY